MANNSRELFQHVPKQMRAAQLCNYDEPYQLTTVETPQIKSDELLIKVHAAGFCHSDLQVHQGQFQSKLPLIPSHEPAGVVVQVGSQCNGSWAVGDRVGVLNFKRACSRCPGCALSLRRSRLCDPRFCENRQMAGFKDDGCLAEYMIADPATTVRLSEGISFDQAAPLMCAGATVWAALEKATQGLEPGAFVGIIGIGGLGHLGIQFAKALGFRTVAIDNHHAGQSLATDVPEPLVPDLVVDSSSLNEAAERIFALTEREGLAATVVCTDSIEVTAWALGLLRIGGHLVPLGLPPKSWRFDPEVLVFRELSIMGSYVASAASTERMMRVVTESGIRSHITRVHFEEVPDLLKIYQQRRFKGRLVVTIASDDVK